MKRTTRSTSALLAIATLAVTLAVTAQSEDRAERFQRMSERAEAEGLAESFRGIAIDGELTPGVFAIESTGVSTEPVRVATLTFLDSLSEDQRQRTRFEFDDPEWRKWMNQHFYVRAGVGFDEMDETQRQAAFAMMRASLSAKGLRLTRDIMRLNRTLGELNDGDFDEYNEWLYWITVMGEPSADKPWGWQLDGHHVIINYFVLGDQVVMSPLFVGSEPVTATAGRYAGTQILQDEQDDGLAFLRGLSPEQRLQAVLNTEKEGNNNVGEAFSDNLDLAREGIAGAELDEAQRNALLDLISLYVGNMDDGHAPVKMSEVAAHVDDTWFSWVGGSEDDSVYYYRILSPVILIEFDHQRPANLRHLYPPVPNREHIHAVVRTPNGNDYGKDLLRQHLEQHPH
jgi:hypothetical protein